MRPRSQLLLHRCVVSQKWEVIEPCDAACGKGKIMVMRQARRMLRTHLGLIAHRVCFLVQVLQKEADDEACKDPCCNYLVDCPDVFGPGQNCTPEYKWLPCVRRHCTGPQPHKLLLHSSAVKTVEPVLRQFHGLSNGGEFAAPSAREAHKRVGRVLVVHRGVPCLSECP